MRAVDRCRCIRIATCWRSRLCCWLLPLLVFSAMTKTVSSDQEDATNQSSVSLHHDNAPVTIDTNNTISQISNITTLATETNNRTTSFDDPELVAMRKKYWQKTFDEIREAPEFFSSFDATKQQQGEADRSGTTWWSQWKLLLDERSTKRRPTRRFEGFISWDRLLQDWADDIQEYLEKTQQESGGEYPFSTYGRPSSSASSTITKTQSRKDKNTDNAQTNGETDTAERPKHKKKLPVPQPAKPGEEVLPHTDLSDLSKHVWIVTTASLPWKTGTAVNPLLRAAYLTKGRNEAGGSVTLMVPWLERSEDQERVYGDQNMFQTPKQQEDYIRNWLLESAKMPQASQELRILWYTAWQSKVENSIYSMGDITALIPDEKVDICILEEPEHLNWYRAPGESWTAKFQHVVGILHTNYFQYAMDQPAALVRAPAMSLLCSWMCRAHCNRVIKLSGTLAQVAPEKELVENVHGVRETFIDVGAEVRERLQGIGKQEDVIFGADADPTIYFIGKLLWSKGLGSLMELLKYAEETADLKVKVDMYGGGPDMKAAEAKSQKLGLDMPFHGPLDHAEIALTHKIFVNPSTSEVLCTTSAEALAMGKFVILPSHPSNDFFAQFPNCLTYATKEEFVGNLYYAMTHAPEPLSEEYAHVLSWEAATERLIAASCIPVKEAVLLEQAVSADEASIEIPLPPIVEREEDRLLLVSSLSKTRDRFRQFRTRLSNEVRQSKVLPKPLRDSLLKELDKRLDFDFDEFLSSPKFRLSLSPAELDKSLLELYNTISESPSGDMLRLIGGGGPVGLQNMYMRRQAQKELMRRGSVPSFFPPPFDEAEAEGTGRTPSEWVRFVMQKNRPDVKNIRAKGQEPGQKTKKQKNHSGQSDLKMCYSVHGSGYRPTQWSGLRPVTRPSSLYRPRPRSVSLLI